VERRLRDVTKPKSLRPEAIAPRGLIPVRARGPVDRIRPDAHYHPAGHTESSGSPSPCRAYREQRLSITLQGIQRAAAQANQLEVPPYNAFYSAHTLDGQLRSAIFALVGRIVLIDRTVKQYKLVFMRAYVVNVIGGMTAVKKTCVRSSKAKQRELRF
jgi:hypothetical protein